MHERIRRVLLDGWARAVTRRPRLTLGLSLLLAVTCILATWRWLEFRPDRSDLVAADLDWSQRYAEHKEYFPRWNDLVVCIAGDEDDGRIDVLARSIAETLQQDNRVAAADAGHWSTHASPKMFLAAPPDQFEAALDDLSEAHALLERAPNANAALAVLTSRLNIEATDAAPAIDARDRLRELRRILNPYLQALFDNPVSFNVLTPDRNEWIPLRSESGRIRFINVHFTTHTGAVDTVSANIRWLREQVGALIADSDRSDIEWGVTGVPAIEADETAQSIRDSTLASILALALITALMIAVFRGVAVPLIAATTLLIGIAWSFGWLMLAVGHLQLLSVVFTVILLGLGIDFAVHLLARLELLRDTYERLPDAMSRVFQGMGPGLITGALTTAAAFGVTSLTKFRGMAEMGVIAAGGILLCLIASFCVLPALLAVIGWKRVIRHRHGGETAHFAHGRLDGIDRRPVPALVAAGVCIIAMIWPALDVRYDPNVLKLHPPGIESVRWEREIVADGERSAWAGLAHTTPGDAPALTEQFRARPEVSDVGGMGALFPAQWRQRLELIEQMRADAAPPITAPPTGEVMMNQLLQIQTGLRARVDITDPQQRSGPATALIKDISRANLNWMSFDSETKQQRYDRVEHAYQQAVVELRRHVEAALRPGPLDVQDLPPVLRTFWVGDDGRWLLEIYPADDPQQRSVLHPDRLGEFVTALRTVDADVLGPPVQIFESSELIKREYLRAAAYALIAVLVLLFLDFQSLGDALAAMLPVGVGFLGTFAMLGLIDMPLNFANIIVMPLIFGIGVDAGVHIVHRWRVEPLGRPAGLSGATGRGITLTMLTTIIGFGCMLSAQHRGIRSLGLVMVTGLVVTLAACYIVLPPVLRLRTTQSIIDEASERGPAAPREDG